MLPTGASGTYDDAGELQSSVLSGTTMGYTYNADGEQLTSVQGTTTAFGGDLERRRAAGHLQQLRREHDRSHLRRERAAGLHHHHPHRAGSTVTQGYVWNAQPRQHRKLLMDGANAYVYTTGTAPA